MDVSYAAIYLSEHYTKEYFGIIILPLDGTSLSKKYELITLLFLAFMCEGYFQFEITFFLFSGKSKSETTSCI